MQNRLALGIAGAAVVVVAAVVVLVIVIVSSEGFAGNLSGAERARLTEIADLTEERGLTRPIFPVYVPDGLQRLPVFGEVEGELRSEFRIDLDEPPDGVVAPLLLSLTQTPYDESLGPIPAGTCEDSDDVRCVIVNEETVPVGIVGSVLSRTHDLLIRVDDQVLSISIQWRSTEELSGEADDLLLLEIVEVAESLYEAP